MDFFENGMDLIDRRSLLELYANPEKGELILDKFHVPVAIIRQNILDMPTVNAVPAKRAFITRMDFKDGSVVYECSNCQAVVPDHVKVCPHCSAADCVTVFAGVQCWEEK